MAAKRIPPAELAAAMGDDPQKAEAMIDAKNREIGAQMDAANAGRQGK